MDGFPGYAQSKAEVKNLGALCKSLFFNVFACAVRLSFQVLTESRPAVVSGA
jgi:hypothetical protein